MRVWTIVRLMLAAVAAIAPVALGEVRLPAVISDHMVLQAGQPIVIWGWCDAGEQVKVSFDGQEASVSGGTKWKTELKPHAAGGPYELSVSGATNTIVVKDVLVGEVWLGSGQSNMQWPVKASNNPDAEIAAARYPDIRLFSAPRVVAQTPQEDVEGAWVACSPETIAEFSAVLYYFGVQLRHKLQTPVGLIHTSWGGTPAEAWTSRAALEADEDLKRIVAGWDKKVAEYPAAKAAHDAAMEQWKKDVEKAKAAGQPEPAKPGAPQGPESSWLASGLYNAMIHPFVPYAVKGAVWYQGESNAGRAHQYRKLFPAMIQDWRKAWGQEHFSFYFVQLANFTDTLPEPADSEWAELREAQSMTLALPETGQAVIIDIGEAKDIHPKNKQDVGKRLALNALAKDYGKRVEYAGPVYRSMQVMGDKVTLSFDHAKGMHARGGGKLVGFSIAGADQKFVWADAEIKGKRIVVSSPLVKEPAAVRYAWANNPVCNLYNGAGLPASPFRTDDWPCKTLGKE